MNTWNVFLTHRAHKQLRNLPGKIQKLAGLAIEDLGAGGPVPGGWDVRKTDEGEYRMRYRLLGERLLEIEVFYIGHRRDAYK